MPSNSIVFTQINGNTYQTNAYVASYTGPKFYAGEHGATENTSSTPVNGFAVAIQPTAVVVYTLEETGDGKQC